MTKEELGLEVWKETLEVQRHFNELGMRVRSIAITVLAAFMGAAGYAFKERNFTVASLVLYGSIICWAAFYCMDRGWYHRLLRASVRHGEEIEANLADKVPDVGLTIRISRGSPVWGLTAGERLTLFYLLIGYIQWVAAVTFTRPPKWALITETMLLWLLLLVKYAPKFWRHWRGER